MADSPRPFTHTAFALKREGKKLKFGRWLEIGVARQEGSGGAVQVFIDRLPVGGFSGHVYLAPAGAKPPVIEPEPHRPALAGDDDGDSEG
jgi:hypothetical protein